MGDSRHSLPSLTRRHLLAAGGASGAAAVVALNPRLASAATALASDPAYLRRSSYAGLVGQRFDVEWWGSAGGLTLRGVRDLGPADVAGRDDAFSLVFTADPSVVVGKDPLLLGHRSLGAFQLLVVPIGPAGSGQELEAVVNRTVGVDRRAAPSSPSAPAPQASAGGAQEAVHSFLRRASVRRTRHGVRVDVVLADESRATRAYAWLIRGERVVAAFGPRSVHDHHAIMRAPRSRRLPRGRYVLVVGTGRADGALARVPVKLR